ncbi:MAG: hypothetical protein NTX73_05980 [Rhodobacterales bacterium]|jgi:hypothetical protein|nr:hypothetical protein [Rhodobacterales bacterium]
MRDISINLAVTDEADLEFIIMPGSDMLFGQMGAALRGVDHTLIVTLKALRTLADLQETKGARPGDIAKTVASLREPNRLAKEQIEYLITLFSRAVRVSAGPATKGQIQ